MKDTLVLKDGSIIELESGASLSALVVLSSTKEDFVATWNKFTVENLSEVMVKSGSGVVVANYTNLVLVNETSTITDDGISTVYKLREKSEIEIRLDAIEAGQEIQNEAIDDLATIRRTSRMRNPFQVRAARARNTPASTALT